MQVFNDLARVVQVLKVHVRPDCAVGWKQVASCHSTPTPTASPSAVTASASQLGNQATDGDAVCRRFVDGESPSARIYNKTWNRLKQGKRDNPRSEWVICRDAFPPIVDRNIFDKAQEKLWFTLGKWKEGRRAMKESKIRQIKSNPYLNHALSKLQLCKGQLFTFGFSFSDQDKHIRDAITRNPGIKFVWIGIRGDFSKESNQRLLTVRDEMIAQRLQIVGETDKQGHGPLQVHFYDTEAMDIWGLNIEPAPERQAGL